MKPQSKTVERIAQEIVGDLTDIEPVVNRRDVMKGGSVIAASTAFAAMANRARAENGYSADYGQLYKTEDKSTGLPLLALPRGFSYYSFGWTGQIKNDMRPTPTDHDGMAVVAANRNIIALVRNYEQSLGESNRSDPAGGKGVYNPLQYGGTGNLFFNARYGRWLGSYNSLGGCIRNCAGGLTPWGTWISCEETFHDWNQAPSGQESFNGYNHGYCFEVPGFGISDGKPIRGMGRFSHEACCTDPSTGYIYETEDDNPSAFYKYVPNGPWGELKRSAWGESENDGINGKLYAMVVNGMSRMDLRSGLSEGMTWPVTWQEVPDPDATEQRCFDQAPDAAIVSRGEGCWWDGGKAYFCSTDGGDAELGQIFCYDPRKETLTLLFESKSADEVDGPDNIAVSPRGSILMCEDGDRDPKWLVGLTKKGDTFPFAENCINLSSADLKTIDKVFPGTEKYWWDTLPEDGSVESFTSREWAGACFYGRWLFVNIQSPGVTFAITGPWENGAL